MTDKFQIGEVAIYVRPGSSYYGDEVTIISGLQLHAGGADLVTGARHSKYPRPGYLIRHPEIIGEGFADPAWLRKKKPPQREIDQVTTWDKCAWRPKELQHA